MDELIQQYRDSLRDVRKLQLQADLCDRKILSGMASDLQFAIEWMRNGRMPGARHGIERRAVYKRETLTDNPLKYQKYFAATFLGHKGSISESDLHIIEEALKCLSKLEKEIYLMARGQCLSRNEIARMLGVQKGTVNKVLSRADTKILKHKQTCLPFANYI